MNVALAASGDLGDDMNKVIDALSENGFNSKKALVPVSKDYKFMYSKANDCIVLVNEKNEVVYPEDITYDEADLESLENSVKYLNAVVTDAKSFSEAIENGQMEIKLEENVTIADVLYVPKNSSITIDLNGKTLDASSNGSRPIEVMEGSSLTINAEGATINCGAYGLVNIPTGVNASVVVNGGTYNADLDNGAFIKVRPGGEDTTVNVTLNNVTYVDQSDDSALINMYGYEGTLNLTINGGSFKTTFGAVAHTANISNAKFDIQGMAFEILGSATITNCEITTADKVDGTAPAAGVAVASNGEATVSNCTINTEGYGFAVYSSGGKITATNNTITAAKGEYLNTVDKLYDGSEKTIAYISINGDVKVDVEYTK
jgi:parallel beta-helix repeat protein